MGRGTEAPPGALAAPAKELKERLPPAPAREDGDREDQGPLERRASVLERMLGDRAPWLVRWLPVAGAALGVGFGLGMAVFADVDWLIVREVSVVLGAVVGLLLGRTAGEHLESAISDIPASDVPERLRAPTAEERRHDAMTRRGL
ncbi:hypothetical protein [Conexibacter sp. SYSU D00693]|uniref:hypothetical protein n=1 Tax=Conexibacter sp. SYSU D00693 TaxID=2812560 RepID=UPI00196AD7ED|nr:hypothetical protein [Conexibacter sp. SYSU D00693]